MAGQSGRPETNGSWAQTPSGAKTKAYARLFETISSSGCNDEGVAWGVHYISTRRATGGGQLSKMDAWPALKNAFAHWKRSVQSAAAQVPAMARALSPNPPEAPSMEALMQAFDVKTVIREFMNGNYVLYPAESAEGFHCTDEKFGTNALSAMVYRKGSTAWHVVDAVHEYELSTKRLATERAMPMRTPMRTDGQAMAQSASSRLRQLMRPEAKVNADREAAESAGVELPDASATWNFGDLISESDSGVSGADTTRQIRARTGNFTDEFEQFVREVIEKVAAAGCALVEMNSTWFEENECQEEVMAGQSIAQRRMLPGQENENPAVLFHEATGHPSKELMKWMCDHPEVSAVEISFTKEDVEAMGPCYGCMMGAMKRAMFNGSWSTVESMSNAIVFTDSWGPAKTAANGGYRFTRIFVTRRSRFTFSYLMRLEKDLIKATEKFLVNYQSEFNTLPHVMFMDNAPGHLSEKMAIALSEKGVRAEYTAPYTGDNNVAEVYLRITMAMARTMLHHAGMPLRFWGDAVLMATHIRNRLPTKGNAVMDRMSAYQMETGKAPDLSKMVPFGTTGFAHQIYGKQRKDKMEPTAVKVKVIGYAGKNQLRVHDEATGKTFVTRNVKLVPPGSVVRRGGDGAFQDFRKEVEDAKKDGQLKSTEGVGGAFEKIKWDTEAEAQKKRELAIKVMKEHAESEIDPEAFKDFVSVVKEVLMSPKMKCNVPDLVKLYKMCNWDHQGMSMPEKVTKALKMVFAWQNGRILKQSEKNLPGDVPDLKVLVGEKFKMPDPGHMPGLGLQRGVWTKRLPHSKGWVLEAKVELQQENPKREKSKSYERYEKYTSATTLGEMLAKGAKHADVHHDHKKGFLEIYVEEDPLRPGEMMKLNALGASAVDLKEITEDDVPNAAVPVAGSKVSKLLVADIPKCDKRSEWDTHPLSKMIYAAKEIEMAQLWKTKTIRKHHDETFDRHRVIKSRLVVEFKSHADGTLRKVKVRCVAKGYMQAYGRDYTHTYAPTIATKSLRLLLTLACEWEMELFGFDVEGAFLIPTLKEFILIDIEGEVYVLLKSLYGLKQAAHEFYMALTKEMERLEMKRSRADPCFFYQKHPEHGWVLAVFHVDDGIGAAESAEGYQSFVNAISFPLTSVGVPDYVLKINLRRKDSMIYLSIENYINKMAKDFGMEGCKHEESRVRRIGEIDTQARAGSEGPKGGLRGSFAPWEGP